MKSEAARRAGRLRRLRRERRWLLYELEVRYCREFCPEALRDVEKEDGKRERV